MTTGQEMIERMVAHVRRLVEQRDLLNEEIEQAEQFLQDMAAHLAATSRRLRKATTPERMTMADATRYLRASKNTIKMWIAADHIPSHVDTDGRRYLVKSEIDRWLVAGCRPSAKRAA